MTYKSLNKKANTPITFFFVVAVFVLVWAGVLSKWFATIGETAIANGSTGVEAFIYSNLNFIVFCALVISIMAYGVWGGQD